MVAGERSIPSCSTREHSVMEPESHLHDAVEELLAAARRGEVDARDRLIALLYDDLRRTAGRLMRSQRPDHTLQPTALVNEAVLKLLTGNTLQDAIDRQHLARAAVQAMRQVLVDHHRHRASRKGPGRWQRQSLESARVLTRNPGLQVEALDEALDRLAAVDARACLVSTFHVFLGLSLPAVGEALEISQATVERDWQYARAWLREQLASDSG